MNEDPLHKQATEQVIDYFLHELISGQPPPDLSQRISAAWAREQAESTDAARRSPSAQPSVQARPIAAGHSVIARPLHSGTSARCTVQRDSLSRGISLRRQILASVLATGACGLLVLLSWQLVDPDLDLAQRMLKLARNEVRNLANPPILPEARPVQSAADQAGSHTTPPSLAASPPASDDSSEPATTSQVATTDSSQKPAPPESSVALFPLDQQSAANDSSRTGTSPASGLPTDTGKSATGGAALPLDEQQIVAQIDQRLANMWQELAVTPSPRFDEAQRARQVSLALTGQPPSGTAGDLDALIASATASLPFARQWAGHFVGRWLAGSSLPADDARVETLNRHFAQYIYENRPWNATALELLGGSLPTAAVDKREFREAKPGLATGSDGATSATGLNPIATAFVSALGGDGNHRLVSHIGTNFLDINLSCARCHDANSSSLAAQWSSPAQDAEHAVGRQAAYWSLTAMLQGIDTKIAKGGKPVVVDRQAEMLAAGEPLTAYYDLIDGRLQAVEPRLPDGQTWKTVTSADVPRQALAQWLSQSPAMDQATVNQVWCMIFGQPLVPHPAVRLSEAVDGPLSTQSAEQQQRELLELLSTQYRAHGHDLKRLVGWIVRSDAFSRQPWRPTHAQWLAASQDELRQWRAGRGSFANGARPAGAGNTQSLKASLASVLQWRERSNADEETALAQPLPNLAPIPASTPDSVAKTLDSKASVTTNELDDRLRLAPPSAAELAFVDRLLANQRLSWKDHVEHIVCLAPEVRVDKRIRFLADELLRQHKGDARAALLDLLWAVNR